MYHVDTTPSWTTTSHRTVCLCQSWIWYSKRWSHFLSVSLLNHQALSSSLWGYISSQWGLVIPTQCSLQLELEQVDAAFRSRYNVKRLQANLISMVMTKQHQKFICAWTYHTIQYYPIILNLPNVCSIYYRCQVWKPLFWFLFSDFNSNL